MEKVKITIVTVTYNCKETLQKTIDSVSSQDYANIEYIIVDGGSTDGTLDIIRSNQNVISKWLSEKDNGIFDAMNKAIDISSGEWINFMNSGDVFYSDHVISDCFSHEMSKKCGVVYGDTYTIKGKFKLRPFIYRSHGYSPMGICHQSLFTRVDLARTYQFSSQFKVAADYNMIRSIYNDGYEFYYTDCPVSVFDLYGFSKNNAKLQLKETAMICNAQHSFRYYLSLLTLNIKIIVKKIIKYDS